jgi:hypothetical protein
MNRLFNTTGKIDKSLYFTKGGLGTRESITLTWMGKRTGGLVHCCSGWWRVYPFQPFLGGTSWKPVSRSKNDLNKGKRTNKSGDQYSKAVPHTDAAHAKFFNVIFNFLWGQVKSVYEHSSSQQSYNTSVGGRGQEQGEGKHVTGWGALRGWGGGIYTLIKLHGKHNPDARKKFPVSCAQQENRIH